jgi:hypothetical protein
MAKAKAKLSAKPISHETLGSYLVVMTPQARAVVEAKGKQVLMPIKTAGIGEPQELVLHEEPVDGRNTVLVAFLNPYIKTAYVDFLDAERLNSAERTRENAMRNVSLGIGSRPDLPPGDEYVREIWRNLIA